MHTFVIMALLYSITAQALTGKVEIDIQPTKHGDFRGLFWNSVDKTVGRGISPVITEMDVRSALREEFTDPNAADAQLEKLKGPDGTIKVGFGYRNPDMDHENSDGDLTYHCGVADSKGKHLLGYAEFGGIVSRENNFKEFPRYSSDGKFFQFKWASKAQIKRSIAKCFARLPGMPPLKAHAPKDRPEFIIEEEIYHDYYQWFSKIPNLSTIGHKDPKFRQVVKCMMDNAMKKIEDRTGNVVVLQKVKNTKDSPLNGSTFISEMDNLPPYSDAKEVRTKYPYIYSIAFMDQPSLKKLKTHRYKGAIHTQGIWPNYQGGSVASLMGQCFGDELHVNMKACLLSSGLRLPNLNSFLETLYNPYQCREVDSVSVSPQDRLEYFCTSGRGESCVALATYYQYGKSLKCLPKDMGGECHLEKAKVEMSKAKKYYTKACDLGTAEGCYAMGTIIEKRFPGFHSTQSAATSFFQKGCQLKATPNCFFYMRGLSHVDQSNWGQYTAACKSMIDKRKACHAIGIYHVQKGERGLAKELLQTACKAHAIDKSLTPCKDLAKVYLEEGNTDEAKKIMKESCSFIDTTSCRDLYDLSTQEEQAEMIQKICWQTKKVCF